LYFSLVFRERGDVWRFMRSIGQAIEGRVFRKTDAMKVKLLLRVISKTTGQWLDPKLDPTLQIHFHSWYKNARKDELLLRVINKTTSMALDRC
jgi:hypothetical protein